MSTVIPPITDPMGKYWNQPSRDQIEVDDTHALMSQQTFKQLPEYSTTFPTGVYDGKMWRRHDGVCDPNRDPSNCKWLLCWYGPSDKPDRCSIEFREVLIVDEKGQL